MVPGFETGEEMQETLAEMNLLRNWVDDSGTNVAQITEKGMLTFMGLSLFAKPKLLFECLQHAQVDGDDDKVVPGLHTNVSAQACSLCKRYAPHKVEEDRTAKPGVHPYTTYLCCICFATIMGPVAAMDCGVEI